MAYMSCGERWTRTNDIEINSQSLCFYTTHVDLCRSLYSASAIVCPSPPSINTATNTVTSSAVFTVIEYTCEQSDHLFSIGTHSSAIEVTISENCHFAQLILCDLIYY